MASNNSNQPNPNVIPNTLSLSQQQQQQANVGNTTTFILNPSSNTAVPSSLQSSCAPISHINQMIASSPLITQQQLQQQQAQQQQNLAQFQQQQQHNSNQMNPGSLAGRPQQMNGPIMAGPVPTSNINSKPNINNNNNNNDEQKINQAPSNDNNQQNNLSNVNSASVNNSNGPITDSKQPIQNLHPVVVLDKQRLQELVQEVDPNEQLEEEVEDVLLSIADDFIESLVTTSCMISRHRKATTLDVKDVQLALEKNWNMWIPGFGVDGVVGVFSGNGLGQNSALNNRLPKKCMATEAHKQRLALIKKTLKKF